MSSIIQLNILQFSLIYLLLIVVLILMKRAKINQTKLLLLGTVRMTVQLVLAGFILTYIFANPHPLFTVAYIAAMVIFSITRILSRNKWLNKSFKIAVSLSLTLSGVFILAYFTLIVVGVSVFNPQYTIPIGGMIIGNSMTGITLALKTFNESITSSKSQIESLLNLGSTPKRILLPYVNRALETALLPTINSMLGMGIIALPGLMTGQILSGTSPSTAILYQIAIMVAITTSVCLSVFCSLHFGYKTLYNKQNQISPL
ncbi:MAG TPA: iron export ABC transporter permease subunit FetB [Anaerovoracaceae bacterium]|nr:iron export ABC transporter permease subunit FetB [Anaerovoracaceae bacterium]